jgi:hypothetical protein
MRTSHDPDARGRLQGGKEPPALPDESGAPADSGRGRKGGADFLDSCRSKRNIVEYDRIGAVSGAELGNLIELMKELREGVLRWLRERHPELG